MHTNGVDNGGAAAFLASTEFLCLNAPPPHGQVPACFVRGSRRSRRCAAHETPAAPNSARSEEG